MPSIYQFLVPLLLVSVVQAVEIRNQSSSEALVWLIGFEKEEHFCRLESGETVSLAVHVWKDAQIRNKATNKLYVFRNLINYPIITIKDHGCCETVCDWLKKISS